MQYFIDTEFLEGTQDKTILGFKYGNTKPTIDLISIGIVAEDGREYYAISKEFNLKEAWNRHDIKIDDLGGVGIQRKEYWIRDNVLKPIFNDLLQLELNYRKKANQLRIFMESKDWVFNYEIFKNLISKHGKTNKQIAKEIKEFVYETTTINNPDTILNWEEVKHLFPIEFYGYFADYDWVVFCWLFGKMIDLPRGFPYYCKDLKQELDNKVNALENRDFFTHFEKREELSFKEKLKVIKDREDYPKQTNEHNALSDAKWNKQLYEFIQKL